MTFDIHLHFHGLVIIKSETEMPADELAQLNLKIEAINMKLSEVKAAIAESAKNSTEAFAELSTKLAEQQSKIDQLVLDASDPDVTDEDFLADLTTVQTNAKALADIVPAPPEA